MKKLSPFAIQKGLESLAGEPKSVKKLRNGSLLIECATERHSINLLKSKTLCNIPINVIPHTTLNFSKGVVRSKDLEGVSEEEICENLSSQGVSSVKRIKVCWNNELVPTNTLIIQWKCHGLRPNYDELSLLIVKHNPMAVCLQELFLKDTDNITVRGFNLYHKFQETENRASGGVSILVNENIPQSIVS